MEEKDRVGTPEQRDSGFLANRGLSVNPVAMYLGPSILMCSLQRQVESLILSELLGRVGCLNQVSQGGEGGGK